jgi:energy-coupling factor transport system ATP-binding protein
VLLVDEPTRGLDPAARDLVASALVRLADDGAAVLVASHEPDLTALADRVVTMDAGTLGAAPAALLVQPRATTPPRLDTALGNTPLRTTRTPVQAELRHVPPAAGTRRPPLVALLAANLVALAAFCWPLVGTALPAQAHAAVPVVALALAPLAALVVVATLDGTVRSAHLLALLGTLTAIGAAVRIASTGAGGVEAVFILLILAGRAFGARFGMLLGIATIALSTAVTGSFGPWTPFQMFACAWVGAGAGLLPRRLPRGAEVALLCLYGVVASYGFGLLMNLWFWPFAVGYGTGISYEPGAPLAVNMTNFLLYSLLTSTAGWDTLRAITTVAGILIVGRPVLAALRRTKPLTSPAVRPAAARTPAPVR